MKITHSAKKGFGTLLISAIFAFISPTNTKAQAFPSTDEGIPWLITFGANSQKSWGDDDFCQTFFFSVPKTQTQAIYIRVFDADCGGLNDEMKGEFNTTSKVSVYGGKEAYSNPDAQNHTPIGKYDSGNLLATKSFAVDATTDNQWYTFGPFNPTEGEWIQDKNGYIFKVIVQGISGDDGNVYRYFLSTNAKNNIEVQGANAFTFEYTFRMPNNPSDCHIYPYVDSKVVSVQQYNFDWDFDGFIQIVSNDRPSGESVQVSTDNNWAASKHIISDKEKNTSLDIQFIKEKNQNNNNVVFRITNQYGEAMPFFSIPIGGRPKFVPNQNFVPDK